MSFAPALNEFSKLFGRGINFPSAHEARWITDSVKHSPDLGWLEQFAYHLLFCIDDTKQGHSHHGLISDSSFMATGYTANKFQYWYQQAGEERTPIPIEVLDGKQSPIRFFPPTLKIKGELRLVRSQLFKELDNYKRNTVQFRRKRVTVFVPYRELWYKVNQIDPEDRPALFRARELPRALQGTYHPILSPQKMAMVRAYMYVARPEFWNDLLDAGFRGFKTVNYYESKRPWLKEYYDYPSVPI